MSFLHKNSNIYSVFFNVYMPMTLEISDKLTCEKVFKTNPLNASLIATSPQSFKIMLTNLRFGFPSENQNKGK